MIDDLVAIEPVAVQMTFDYDALDSDTRAFVEELDAELDLVLNRAFKDIGLILQRAKDRLSHGQYEAWIASKGIAKTTAWRYRQIAQGKDPKSSNVEHLEEDTLEQPIEPVEKVQEVGKFPTNEDKRKTVLGFFADFPELAYLSNREIARRCGVDHKTVAAIKKELFPEPEPELPTEIEPEVPPVVESTVEQVEIEPEPESEVYTPPDATSQLLQGTQLAQAALEAAIEDKPLIIASEPALPEPEPITEPEPENTEEEQPQEQEPEQIAPEVEKTPLIFLSSESSEWYTPKRYVDAARELMGKIDVDPASCEEANRIVKAEKFYTIDDSGLNHPWQSKVWLNPPYGFTEGKSNQEIWSQELIARYKTGEVTEAVILVNANTETEWFQALLGTHSLVCFTDHRIRFYNHANNAIQPTSGNAFIYFGTQEDRFYEKFRRFGPIMRCIDGYEER